MAQRVNLNADLGESYGAWSMGADAAMLEIVTSANVACGFHAGDPLVIERTVVMAGLRGVGVGAHPSFPDLQGFGRRRMDIATAELEAMLIYQIGALAAICRAHGVVLSHVKPHGALNNMACVDKVLADAVARAVRRLDPSLILLAPALSQLARAGHDAGLPVVEEIFADRAYLDDGMLVPRSRPDAMIHGAQACFAHVQRMLDAGAIVSISGKRLPVSVQSICVHGDNADAVATARTIRDGLESAGWELVPLSALAAPPGPG
jgi:UPF0271 protein